jgi:putative transposase
MSIIRGNIRPDHVQVLIRAPSHLSPAKIAQYLKGRTGHKLMREFPELRKRGLLIYYSFQQIMEYEDI